MRVIVCTDIVEIVRIEPLFKYRDAFVGRMCANCTGLWNFIDVGEKERVAALCVKQAPDNLAFLEVADIPCRRSAPFVEEAR